MTDRKYCSSTWFTLSVWPFVWGWWAVDSFVTVPRISRSRRQKWERNCGPRSEITSSRNPCNQIIWVRNNSAVALPEISLLHGMKWAIFVKPSSTTSTESKPLVVGRSVMKFKEIDAQGRSGRGSGEVNHKGDDECFSPWHTHHMYGRTPWQVSKVEATSIPERLVQGSLQH